jgi:choice-of-anchor B domain-containing protein
MKRYFFSISLLFFSLISLAQLNITELSNLEYTRSLSDVWGWSDGNGIEYALVGVNDGFSIVDISTPETPVEILFEAGNTSIWRDIKTWNNHAYVTTEGGGGLLIVDLLALPNDTILTYYSGDNFPFTSAHNIYIDENGVAYIFGAASSVGAQNSGTIMLDLTQDPLAPVELGVFDTYYVHDGVVRGDTLWASCINDGIQATVDVSDKTNPVVMGTWATPGDFAHNCWFSDDGKYLFTTDEKEFAYIASYDVSDLSNVVELDRWQSNPGTGTIPHNAHYMDGYLITSYYNDGITINDVSDPARITEVGNFDTSPAYAGNDGGGFHGSWGAYPWLPSGVILSADIENGLFVLKPEYKRAAFLEGKVLEEGTSTLLNGVNVEIIGYGVLDVTNGTGEYSTGIPEGGSIQVVFSALGYISDTVSLTLGVSTVISYDALLAPKPRTSITGEVKNPGWINVGEGMVQITNDAYTYETTANTSGGFSIGDLYVDTYSVIAGKWGYKTTERNNVTIDAIDNYVLGFVEDGYYDDFSFDFGWTVSGNAAAGIWERGIPNGTSYSGTTSNPDKDVDTDILNLAYVTGNEAESGAGGDDVDDGSTILTSPNMDLTDYGNPYVRFYTWFFNGGGNGGAPNDSLIISISNGTDTVVIAQETLASNMSDWVFHNYRIEDAITLTSTMNLIVEALDENGGHLVEAGFDQFRITEGPSSTEDELKVNSISIYPNPFNSAFYVEVDNFKNTEIQITDISGRVIATQSMNSNKEKIQLKGNSGVYFLSIINQGVLIETKKLIKY